MAVFRASLTVSLSILSSLFLIHQCTSILIIQEHSLIILQPLFHSTHSSSRVRNALIFSICGLIILASWSWLQKHGSLWLMGHPCLLFVNVSSTLRDLCKNSTNSISVTSLNELLVLKLRWMSTRLYSLLTWIMPNFMLLTSIFVRAYSILKHVNASIFLKAEE